MLIQLKARSLLTMAVKVVPSQCSWWGLSPPPTSLWQQKYTRRNKAHHPRQTKQVWFQLFLKYALVQYANTTSSALCDLFHNLTNIVAINQAHCTIVYYSRNLLKVKKAMIFLFCVHDKKNKSKGATLTKYTKTEIP